MRLVALLLGHLLNTSHLNIAFVLLEQAQPEFVQKDKRTANKGNKVPAPLPAALVRFVPATTRPFVFALSFLDAFRATQPGALSIFEQ